MSQATTTSDTTEARKRFSFGPVWTKAVLAGTVKDQEKLIAHGVKLRAGTKSDLRRLKMETLLSKVQTAISSAPADAPAGDAPSA